MIRVKRILKKAGSFILAAAVITGGAAALMPAGSGGNMTVRAAETYGDFSYGGLSDGTVEITGYTGKAGYVRIPDKINGKSVTRIGNRAFYKSKVLTDIYIPQTVTSIGANAFTFCDKFTSVVDGTKIRRIERSAFLSCRNLRNFFIDFEKVELGEYAFTGCTGLADENGFTIIGHTLAQYSGDAAAVTVPSGITKIGESAFSDTGITSVTMPYGVKIIGECAFESCPLKSVRIPSTVTTIGDFAFIDTRMTSIVIPVRVQDIGNEALGFYYYDNNDGSYYMRPNKSFIICSDNNKAAKEYCVQNSMIHFDASTELVNRSRISASVVYEGKTVRITPRAEGGLDKVSYRYYYKLSSKSTWNRADSAVIRLGKTGKYDIRVVAKDARNKTSEKCFTVTVKSTPSRLTNVSVIDAEAVRLGRTVTITADAAGGSAPCSYYFLYKLSEKNSYNDLSKGYVRTATRVFKPGKTGTYDIRVIAKDEKGSTSAKDFRVTVR